ncbi:DUF5677 domain-containing protein [Pedobacter sp. N23S346]|uniref:DUF5677 domain-containing protein n=1 Tax=Pedobacter sp. N23S346 TaxID=3402750 RepID=UPI003AC3E377
MVSTHTLDDLKNYHNEAISFFGSELMLLKEVIPKIKNERIGKAGVLLISCGQTGAALLQLASQTDSFTTQSAMLAHAFMETITNFCYVGVCDEHEYRAFILHPIYKQYHNIDNFRIEDDLNLYIENISSRKDKQSKFKEISIVKEALEVFSETKPNLNWTKKTLFQRIEVLEKWGKFMDVFFTINKIQYYSDASEALHGSLYGCTHHVGTFDPEFDFSKKDELEKKLYKDSSCILLHLGMLIHEAFTLISYSDDIKEIWNHSYNNRGQALNLLFHILEKKNIPKG